MALLALSLSAKRACLFSSALVYSFLLGGIGGDWEEYLPRKGSMSRKPRHALIWSHTRSSYELSISGDLKQRFSPTDGSAWLVWLTTERSFAFQGMEGSL